jgi:Tol biopolymer transport system component
MVGRAGCLSLFLGLACGVAANASLFRAASISSTGEYGNGNSSSPSLSSDGRFVAFASAASNLAANDTNGVEDVFVRDRARNITTRIARPTGASQQPSISADGRYVAFQSGGQVYVHDRNTGQTRLLSKGLGGAANGSSYDAQISANGAWVVFMSEATNLIADDTNYNVDVFVAPVAGGAIERVSLSNVWPGHGPENMSPSWGGSISGDGQKITFLTPGDVVIWEPESGAGMAGWLARNLLPLGTRERTSQIQLGTPVYVRDRTAQTTKSIGGPKYSQRVFGFKARISANGQKVAVTTGDGACTPDDTNGCSDILVVTPDSGGRQRIVGPGGVEANTYCDGPSISADGSVVVFFSQATTLDPRSTGTWAQVYVNGAGGTQLVSATAAAEGDDTSLEPAVSGDGQQIAFRSEARNLDPRVPPPNPYGVEHILLREDGPLPDMLIKAPPGAWVGDDVYSSIGAQQQVRDKVRVAATRTYLAALQNDGTARGRFHIHGTPRDASWRVKYFDNSLEDWEDDDITPQVVSPTGWPVSVRPGGVAVVRVEVTPLLEGLPDGGTAEVGDQKTVKVWADLQGGVGQDLVQAITTAKEGGLPDLAIEDAGGQMVGEGIRNPTGKGQRVEKNAKKPVATEHVIQLTNDGAEADDFVLRGTPADPNWGLKYIAREGGQDVDVTKQMTSEAGYTARMGAGRIMGIWAQVKPLRNAVGGAKTTQQIWVTYKGEDPFEPVDMVKAVTILNPDGKPDLWVRRQGGVWVGNDIYEWGISLDQQRVFRSAPKGTQCVYELQLQNDGTEGDDFILRGDAGDPNWQVAYFTGVTGGTDITGPITGAGWGPVYLEPGQSRRVRIEVTALAGAADGDRKRVTVGAERWGRMDSDPVERRDEAGAITIVSAPIPTGAIAGLSAAPTARGAELVFTLAGDSSVSARVLNLAGRPVRTLCTERACQAGLNRLVWDAQADTGLRVPSGLYLIEVTAKAPDGGTARAIAGLRLSR